MTINTKPYDDWIPQSDVPAEALPCSSDIATTENQAIRSSANSIIVLAIAVSQFMNLLNWAF